MKLKKSFKKLANKALGKSKKKAAAPPQPSPEPAFEPLPAFEPPADELPPPLVLPDPPVLPAAPSLSYGEMAEQMRRAFSGETQEQAIVRVFSERIRRLRAGLPSPWDEQPDMPPILVLSESEKAILRGENLKPLIVGGGLFVVAMIALSGGGRRGRR